MLAAFILFIVSAAGLLVLFGHKVFEVRKGEPLMALGIREKGDTFIEDKVLDRKDAIVSGGKKMTKNVIKRSGQISHHVAYSTLHTVNKSLTKTLEKMKGRKSPKPKAGSTPAPASFFLQNMSEAKNDAPAPAPSETVDAAPMEQGDGGMGA